MEEYVMFIV